MKRNLQGKNIVVTGAARGIGENVARLAAARGAHVGMIGLEPEKLASLAADLGPGTVWREADVRDGDALRRAVDEVADTLGGVDSILVNAGVLGYGTVRRTEDATFARVMDINVGGAFHTLKAATPHLERSRGHVLVVASAISFTPLAGLASYAASKAAVEMLTLAYRQEVAHLGISVGLVHPGWTDTDLMRSVDEDLPSFKELRNRLPYPGNVMTDVDDVANAIVDGLARRRKRIYVPRAVGISNWTKGLVNSAGAWPLLKRTTSALVPSLENEVERLGRQEQKVPRSTGR